jgi:hypothetical protein
MAALDKRHRRPHFLRRCRISDSGDHGSSKFMRTLFIIIVVVALGYLGWVFREELTGKIEMVSGSGATPAPAAVAQESAAPAATGEPAAGAATPIPRQMAPAGSLYVKERVSVETSNGIKALNAGELVKVMYRNKDGTARVTTDKADVTIKESFLTADPDQIKK